MKKLPKIVGVVVFLAAGIAQADSACNGFAFKIKNNLADNLVATSVKLNGASIQPGSLEKLQAGSEIVFTVNGSADNVPMEGHFEFATISLPSKKVKIDYTLVNNGLICEHTNVPIEGNDYAVEKTRLPGKVDYTISNK